MSKVRRTYKYRLWPNRKQREVLFSTLEVCRQLYNDALKERREAWKLCRTCVSFSMQSAQLPACKAADPALGKVYSQVLQDVLHRVDKTYQAFFRRGRGFPRFKGKGWFDSFTYPQAGFGVNGGRLSLSKIGNVKIIFPAPPDSLIDAGILGSLFNHATLDQLVAPRGNPRSTLRYVGKAGA